MDWREELTGLVFPRRCPICDDIVRPRGELICPECRSVISFVHEPCCKKCGKTLEDPDREYCGDCLRRTRSFEAGISLLNYEGPAADSIARIKYHNKREYLDYYADEAMKEDYGIKPWHSMTGTYSYNGKFVGFFSRMGREFVISESHHGVSIPSFRLIGE